MALLDQNNNFCSNSECSLTFKGNLNVGQLHVKGDMVMDKNGDKVFGIDIDALDSSRQT